MTQRLSGHRADEADRTQVFHREVMVEKQEIEHRRARDAEAIAASS